MATFRGGDALQRRLAEIGRRIDSAKSVSAGLHAGATYPDGTSVPMVGTVQEFGAPARGIPPRPWIRPAVKDNSKAWGDYIAHSIVDEGFDAKRTLELVGEKMKGDIQASIQSVTSPPLKPQTVERKGFDKPLIDTGVMLRNVDYEVQE